MIYLKRLPIVTLAVILLSLVLQLFFFQSVSLVQTINWIFSFSMLFLLIGFFLAASRAGTFDSIQWHFYRLFSKGSSATETTTIEKWSEKVELTYVFPLQVGFTLFFISMVLLAVYYFI